MGTVSSTLTNTVTTGLGYLLYPIFKIAFSHTKPIYDGIEEGLVKLDQEVEIRRDERGIPHIVAHTIPDLFKIQGYVHAQDRFWQMETLRRLAAGRMSEIVGEIALNMDKLALTLGFARLAEADFEVMKENGKEILSIVTAYAEGVNAFLQLGVSTPEIRLLGYEPEPWTVLDTLMIARVLPYQMGYGMTIKITRTIIASVFGYDAMMELFPGSSANAPPAMPDTGPRLDRDFFMKPVADLMEHYPADLFESVAEVVTTTESLGPGGSNCWVISKDVSATGGPILSNDTHLSTRAPGTFYDCHLKLADGSYNTIGSSFAGVPMIIIGHNDNAAWGVTLGRCDEEDVFAERMSHDGAKYEFEGELRDTTVFSYEIRVKGGESVKHTVYATHHGPVISNDITGCNGLCLSVSSSMQLPAHEMLMGYMGFNRMKSFGDFRQAGKLMVTPSLNWMYADIDGHIGYQLTGTVHKRERDSLSNWCVVPGWTGKYDWKEDSSVPFDEMPHAVDPKDDWLISTNHCPYGASYPHFLGNIFLPGERAIRIEEMLAQSGKRMDVDLMVAMQGDVVFNDGLFIARYLQTIDPDDPMIARLVDWDGSMEANSVPAAICQVIIRQLMVSLTGHAVEHVDPHVSEGVDPVQKGRLYGEGYHPILKPFNAVISTGPVQIRHILEDETPSYWLKRQGGKVAWIKQAVKQAQEWLTAKLGDDMDEWTWGSLHKLAIQHQMSGKAILEPVFRVNGWGKAMGGNESTVMMTADNCWKDDWESYKVDNAAVVRYVYDVSNWDQSVSVLQHGVSGNPFSPYYCDQADRWARNDPYPLHYSSEAVVAHTAHRMVVKAE